MSRVGKKPVVVPAGVTVSVSADNTVTVKGPKGTLTQVLDRDIQVEIKEGELVVGRPTDQIRHRALHGLYRALIANMVKGVTEGFTKKNGIGGCRLQSCKYWQSARFGTGLFAQYHIRNS